MKTLLILILFSFTTHAEVSFEDCQNDAMTFANHTRPVAPLPECAGIVDAEADKVQSGTGAYRAFGKGNMLYLERKDASGHLLQRDLLAGDQTELTSLRKIFVDVSARRLYVIQMKSGESELLVYDLDFLGNVTPLNVMRSSTLFGTVTSVRLEAPGFLEVINSAGTYRVNADAETRTSRSIQKAIIAILQ